MNWLIPASGVLLILAAAVLGRNLLRRRPAIEGGEVTGEHGEHGEHGEQRVLQFLTTGTHRLPAPQGDMPRAVQAKLEEAEAAKDMTTLDAFLADVRDAVGADEAVFWRWSEERDALKPTSWSTTGTSRPQHFDMQSGGPLVRWAAEGRVMHFDADARVAVARLAAAPVEHEGRLMGVLSVARAEGLERGREHLKSWLPRHAAQVGRLVSLFEVRRDYGRHMRQNQALLTAAQRLQGHKSQEALGRAICETALQVSSASEAALIRWRSDVSRGWVQHTTPGFKHRAPFPLTQETLTARACTEGTLHLIDDVSRMNGEVALFFDGDGGWAKGTVAIVPLKLEERVIGAIVVTSEEPGVVTSDEGRNVMLLGALAATPLEMVWEMEEVSRRARTDALTGLANRRAFDEQLVTMLAHADRFGHAVSLILVDVDHFKAVNDTWGHEAGDVVLKAIANTLTDGVRAVDVCARFGGEEIAILLPQTVLQGAVELADRLRKSVATKTIKAAATEIQVTISCGVACYPDGVLTKEALFADADRALYEAKSAGRNCVRSAAPKPTGVLR